jgi:hypothetical protein
MAASYLAWRDEVNDKVIEQKGVQKVVSDKLVPIHFAISSITTVVAIPYRIVNT